MTNARAGESAVHDDAEASVETVPPGEARVETIPQSERVTVNLTGKAVQALQRLQEMTGYNKTDCINRALIISAEIERMSREPGAVYWRETPDSDLMLVRFV